MILENSRFVIDDTYVKVKSYSEFENHIFLLFALFSL